VIKDLRKAQPGNPTTVKAFTGYSQRTNVKSPNYVSSQKAQSVSQILSSVFGGNWCAQKGSFPRITALLFGLYSGRRREGIM